MDSWAYCLPPHAAARCSEYEELGFPDSVAGMLSWRICGVLFGHLCWTSFVCLSHWFCLFVLSYTRRSAEYQMPSGWSRNCHASRHRTTSASWSAAANNSVAATGSCSASSYYYCSYLPYFSTPRYHERSSFCFWEPFIITDRIASTTYESALDSTAICSVLHHQLAHSDKPGGYAAGSSRHSARPIAC